MSQETVIAYLEKHKKKWLTAHQIAKGMKVSYHCVNVPIRKLFLQGSLFQRQQKAIPYKKIGYEYKYKRR